MRQRALEQRIMRQMNKANKDFGMIQKGDKILVALSGGKDSYCLLWGLQKMAAAAPFELPLVAYHLDQGQPNYDGSPMKRFMEDLDIPSEIEGQDTYSRVLELTEEGRTYCSVCSRFRRAILYKAADRHGCNKVALGHHRDDLIETLLLNLFYSGQTKSMPPRLVSDKGTHELIRPLAYCREEDLMALSQLHAYEIMPCNLCGSQQTRRQYVKKWLGEMSKDQPHLKGNLLAALGNIQPSHMLDPTLNPLYPRHNENLESPSSPGLDHASDGVLIRTPVAPMPNPMGSKSLPIINPEAR